MCICNDCLVDIVRLFWMECNPRLQSRLSLIIILNYDIQFNNGFKFLSFFFFAFFFSQFKENALKQ